MGLQIQSILTQEVMMMCQMAPTLMTTLMTSSHLPGPVENHQAKVK
jgi:hypothetical protein